MWGTCTWARWKCKASLHPQASSVVTLAGWAGFAGWWVGACVCQNAGTRALYRAGTACAQGTPCPPQQTHAVLRLLCCAAAGSGFSLAALAFDLGAAVDEGSCDAAGNCGHILPCDLFVNSGEPVWALWVCGVWRV